MTLQKVKLFLLGEAKQFPWIELLKPSKKKINICRVCNEVIPNDSLQSFFHEEMTICPSCYTKFQILDKKVNSHGYPIRIIYCYDEQFKNMTYQFKGCNDYELRTIFLEYIKNDLLVNYYNYVIVPAPSSKEGNEKRGFNHVQAVFSTIRLPILPLISKDLDIEQKNLSHKERKNIHKYLSIHDGEKLRNKNVLIVDDVITTGSTIKAMINLINAYSPNKIKILVLSSKDYLSRKRKRNAKIN